MEKAKILGTGSYLPKRVLSNLDLEKMVDTSDEWIFSRTGIRERRIAAKDEYTSDMGLEAAKKALEAASLDPLSIDCILVATLTPDYVFPSTACLIQHALGAKNAAAMDIQAACSGFVYALAIAKAFVEQKQYQHVLIVASEKLSSIVNYEDRSTCVLFGDGAAAAVVGMGPKGLDIESVILGSDGEQAELLILPAGGSRQPATLETVKEGKHFLAMAGNEVFKHAVRRMESSSKACLEKVGLHESDISWLIPHQANLRIIDAIARRFAHLPDERVFKEVVHRFGNTSASSVGLALDMLIRSNRIGNNEKILMTVFGAGLTWGSTILTMKQ